MACGWKARSARTRCQLQPQRPIRATSRSWKNGSELPAARTLPEQGRLRPELAALAPRGERRMGANPHANGGLLLRELHMPDFREYAADVPAPGTPGIGDTHVLGPFLRDVAKLNREHGISGSSGRMRHSPTAWTPCLKRPNANGTPPPSRATNGWRPRSRDGDAQRAPVRGLARRLPAHRAAGLFNCYEAFIHIIDSMFNQHAKWLKVTVAPAVAAQDRLAELPAGLACMAPGSQRLHTPGPRLH